MTVIYDVECFPNFFLYGAIDRDTEECYRFEASERVNQLPELFDHLLSVTSMIGFNNLNYDYQIIHYILTYKSLEREQGADAAYKIYLHSDATINAEKPEVPEWKNKIPQLDLFKLWHLDNKAKRKGLKDIEFILRMSSISSIDVTGNVTPERYQEIIDYNYNDLVATKKLYEYSRKEIDIRKTLGKKYGVRLINANDPKMGSEIFAQKLSQRLNMNVWDLKKLSTYHPDGVAIEDCIFPYITFESKEFQSVLDWFKQQTVYEGASKDSSDHRIAFDQMYYDFGLGGLHAVRSNGIFQPDSRRVIRSCDGSSYYPNLSIKNRFYPLHLTEAYCDVCEELYQERQTYPKGSAENYGLKIALNGTFGKSNDQFSFFKDLSYMLKTTVNGQLLLARLCEMITLRGIGQIIMVNTDGIEVMVWRDKLQEYMQTCEEWERLTRITLEHAEYKKLIIRDVNNYLGIFEDDSHKAKGEFEINKPIWKNHSKLIVPKALYQFYVNNVPIGQTIRDSQDIYDFCISYKANAGMYMVYRTTEGKEFKSNQKVNRYFVSRDGVYLYRHKPDDRSYTSLEAGYRCTLFNDFYEGNYRIDYNYYVADCMRIVNAVSTGQMNLFE